MPEMRAPASRFAPVDWSRPSRRLQRLAWGLIILLAVTIALFSYRYLFGLSLIPESIGSNAFATLWLPLHAGFAATALLLGALQFSSALRKRMPVAHRWVGRVYVVSCLMGAATGLVLAIGSSAGPIASLGFGSLAAAWSFTNILGWQSARARNFATHRRWMIRSWALTLSAVTLRLYITVAEVTGLPEVTAYRAISFLCWVPNLILAELLLRRQGQAAPGSEVRA